MLKEGDWWLKTKSGWRSLRTLADLEAYLDHQIRGELFVFDTVAIEQGKAVLKGRYFDEMRTEMQPIALSVAVERKNTVASHKKEKGGSSIASKGARLHLPHYRTEDAKKAGPQ